LQSHVN